MELLSQNMQLTELLMSKETAILTKVVESDTKNVQTDLDLSTSTPDQTISILATKAEIYASDHVRTSERINESEVECRTLEAGLMNHFK
jgi:hypothetical protein